MCFYLTSFEKKVARKNIIVYKGTYGYNIKKDSFESAFRFYKYKVKTANEKINLLINSSNQIDEGYYSFKTLFKRYKDFHRESSNKYGRFVIPKGSAYYENRTQRVSSQLIYLGPVTIFHKLLALIGIHI